MLRVMQGGLRNTPTTRADRIDRLGQHGRQGSKSSLTSCATGLRNFGRTTCRRAARNCRSVYGTLQFIRISRRKASASQPAGRISGRFDRIFTRSSKNTAGPHGENGRESIAESAESTRPATSAANVIERIRALKRSDSATSRHRRMLPRSGFPYNDIERTRELTKGLFLRTGVRRPWVRGVIAPWLSHRKPQLPGEQADHGQNHERKPD